MPGNIPVRNLRLERSLSAIQTLAVIRRMPFVIITVIAAVGDSDCDGGVNTVWYHTVTVLYHTVMPNLDVESRKRSF